MNVPKQSGMGLAVVIALSIGHAPAGAAKPAPAPPTPPLSAAGEKLEADYAARLEALRAEIINALPPVDDSKRAASLAADKAVAAAKADLAAAQQRLGELAAAQGLVAHAKGKWIGGADKEIAAAKAKLAKAATDTERKAAEADLAKWQQNRAEGEAALGERQARLDKALQDKAANEQAVKRAEQALADAKTAVAKAAAGIGLDGLLTSDKLDGKLARFMVLMEATPRGLATFADQGPAQKQLIERLLADDALLVQMAVADGAKDAKYGEAMQIYDAIQKASVKAREGTFQRLALAIALEHAVPVAQRNAAGKADAPATVDPVGRYRHFEKAFLDGELDPAFEDLAVWDMRMVVDGEEPDEMLAWGRDMLRNYRPDHITTPDDRWRYVGAVRTDVKYGSQDCKYDQDELQFFQNILMNGGVCGRRAFFGRFILRAFGVPTTARPQKGHAALVHWTPDGWVVCLGAGWGNGWTKTPYGLDLDFLATTQARAVGEDFLKVKRAWWIGSVFGEPWTPGENAKSPPGFWNGVALRTQRKLIDEAGAKTLAAVGEDIGEANESKEKEVYAVVKISDADRKIATGPNDAITIPAVATANPKASTGKILFMPSPGGGTQLHYGRNGGPQDFEYAFEAPAAGRYALTARVVTPSWKQSLTVTANGGAAVEMPLPFTVGMWDTTEPVEIELVKGRNVLRFSRPDATAGVTIKEFTLRPGGSPGRP
jgi:predicted  nucleic acid-binding Zn-ribbon protein